MGETSVRTKDTVSAKGEWVERFAAYMQANGWRVAWNETEGEHLPETIKTRYGKLPEQWLDFIACVKCMISSDETVWFLCAEHFTGTGDAAFQWNEWERISLASAENDTQWESEIKKFWNEHLPIVMSVKNGYSYYAIAVKDGSVVYGEEPEFEECRKVADSFADFVEKQSFMLPEKRV